MSGRNKGQRKKILRRRLFVKQSGICFLCEELIDLNQIDTESHANIDHIFPHVRGGTSIRKNLTLVHARCNNAKGELTLDELDRMASELVITASTPRNEQITSRLYHLHTKPIASNNMRKALTRKITAFINYSLYPQIDPQIDPQMYGVLYSEVKQKIENDYWGMFEWFTNRHGENLVSVLIKILTVRKVKLAKLKETA